MRQDLCVYWQLIPTLGLFFSSLLLFGVAVDRLMSTRIVYKFLSTRYYKRYLCAHLFLAVAPSILVESWIFDERTSDEYVICDISTPLHAVRLIFVVSTMAINTVIILCYVLCFFSIRNIMDENSTKQVYRSLFVISTIVLCGWLSGIVVSSIVYFLDLELTLRVHLVSGICVNLATASNFFVYYAISDKYRGVFDEYLLIRRFKERIKSLTVRSSTKVRVTSVNNQAQGVHNPRM
ncbi:hypothetical protein GCK32_011974 [Trichostrongylus colubriformis]|uniref:G-protein coupled receptors family 1 profile domain-containing protein n=1 Tax=Trichostrongylus colubriformis TaxID=6319 RepID=A0AAN8IH31_TRICO